MDNRRGREKSTICNACRQHSIGKKQKKDSFSRVSICRRYLQLPSTPRTLDLAFFLCVHNNRYDFTPAAHARAG